MASVGGVAEKNGCCDVCGGDPVSSRLKILASSVVGKRKARRVRRVVDPNLEDRLKEIRETILSELSHIATLWLTMALCTLVKCQSVKVLGLQLFLAIMLITQATNKQVWKVMA